MRSEIRAASAVGEIEAARAALLDALELDNYVGLIDDLPYSLNQLMANFRHWHERLLNSSHAHEDRQAVHHQDSVRGVAGDLCDRLGRGRARRALSRKSIRESAAGCCSLACTGVVFIAGAKLLDCGPPGAAARCCRTLCRASRAATSGSVVVDPTRAGRGISVQRYRFHFAQIDPAPHRASPRRPGSPEYRTRNPDRRN